MPLRVHHRTPTALLRARSDCETKARQGDPISPNLFTACLEAATSCCDWNTRSIETDGRSLNHIRLADGILHITRCSEDALQMLHELHIKGVEPGLMINISKMKSIP